MTLERLKALRNAAHAAIDAFFAELERAEAETPRSLPRRPIAKPQFEPTELDRRRARKVLNLP